MKISKYMADRKNRAKLAPAKKKRDAEKKRRKKEGLAGGSLRTSTRPTLYLLLLPRILRALA